MKFTAIFHPKKGYYAYHKNQSTIGVEKVKEVRELLGVNVPLTLFKSLVCSIGSNSAHIDIPEEFAFECGLFDKADTAYIEIEAELLTSFIELETCIQRDSINDAIQCISFSYFLNHESIISAWVAEGMPKEWGLKNKE